MNPLIPLIAGVALGVAAMRYLSGRAAKPEDALEEMADSVEDAAEKAAQITEDK